MKQILCSSWEAVYSSAPIHLGSTQISMDVMQFFSLYKPISPHCHHIFPKKKKNIKINFNIIPMYLHSKHTRAFRLVHINVFALCYGNFSFTQVDSISVSCVLSFFSVLHGIRQTNKHKSWQPLYWTGNSLFIKACNINVYT